MPFAQAKVCEYVWVPPVTFTGAEVPTRVSPLLKPASEYERPLTVCVDAAQLAAAARLAVQVAASPPFCPGQLHDVDPPAAGKAGEDGVGVPFEQNASPPKLEARYGYVVFAPPHDPAIGAGHIHDTSPSTSAPVEVAAFGSFTSPATDPDEAG